ADSTTLENRAKGMGLIGAAFGLGFILGPPIGGLMSHLGAARGHAINFYPGLVAATLSALALLFAFFVLGESKQASAPARRGLPPQFDPAMWRMISHRRALFLVIAALFLVILSFAGMETTVTLFARETFAFTARDLGFFFGFMGVIVALIQGTLIGRFSRKVGEKRLVVFGTFSFLLGFVAMPIIADARLLWPVAFLVAVGQGLCYPSLHSLISKSAPPEQMGSVLGIAASMGSLARMIGPVMFGALWDAGAAPAAFFTAAGIVFIAFLLSLRVRDRIA
ncbi:MAG TPA: MFS transporter, partial [Thermoanaerobaculia bacterium]|nr:MFS transporter [Thermoanaerobaculia bacterium]